MQNVLNIVVSLFRTPAMFIAMIALLGLLLQRKSFSDVVKGTLKSFIGMVILTEGVNILIRAITPLSDGFNSLFAIEGAAPIADFATFLESYGTDVGLIMLAGFVLNIIIARFTPFKAIYLTANLLYWYPMLMIAIGVENDLTRAGMYILAVIIQILVFTILPHILRKYVTDLTGQDSFTIGHTTSIYCLVGVGIGKLFGKNEKNQKQSTEDINLPKSLAFFKDTTLVSGIVIMLLYIIIGFLLTGETKEIVFGGQPTFTVALTNGMTFAAGMIVLLQGVRLMLGEIVPAFKGIATKLVPGAVPAMDVPLIFPYGQNALLLGFLIAATTNIIMVFVLGGSGFLTVAIIPLMVACYFDVAPAAIFANKYGGVKAVIVTSILCSVCLTIMVAITIPIVQTTVGNFVQLYGGNEFSFFILLGDLLANGLHMIGL